MLDTDNEKLPEHIRTICVEITGVSKMERLKENLKLRYFISAAIYLVTCAVIYVVEYRVYAGALQTVFVFALVYPPVFVLFALIRGKSERKEPGKVSRTIGYVVAGLVLVCAAFFAVRFLFPNYSQRLFGWQILSLIPSAVVLLIMEIMQHGRPGAKYGAYAVSIVYSTLLVCTVVFVLVAGPSTVANGKDTLLKNGYDNPSFVTHFSDRFALAFVTTGELPEAITSSSSNDPGVYLFTGKRDDKDFAVFIDTGSGRVLEQLDLQEYDLLRNTIEHIASRR